MRLLYCIFLLQHTKFLAYLDKCVDSLIKLFLSVCGRKLYADTSLVLRYYWIVEASNVDALFEQSVGITLYTIGYYVP